MRLVKQGFAVDAIDGPIKAIHVEQPMGVGDVVVTFGAYEMTVEQFAEFAEAVDMVMAELLPRDSVDGPAEAAAYIDRDGSTWERVGPDLYRCDDIDGERGLDEIERVWGPLRRIG